MCKGPETGGNPRQDAGASECRGSNKGQVHGALSLCLLTGFHLIISLLLFCIKNKEYAIGTSREQVPSFVPALAPPLEQLMLSE